jgi:hypothetical protein
MSVGCPLALLALVQLPPSPPPTARAAVVASAFPAASPEMIESARRALTRRFVLLEDAPTRDVLERAARVPTSEENLERLLAQLALALRKLDLSETERLVGLATSEARSLPPTAEGRALLSALAQRQATLAMIRKDSSAQRAAMAVALSASPDLKLDDSEASPALVRLWETTRAELRSAAMITVRIESDPPGALVSSAAQVHGVTPVELQAPAGLPMVVWLTHEGYAPQLVRLAPGSRAVAAPLEALTPRQHLLPLVEAVRRVPASERAGAAAALAAALDVAAIAWVDAGSPEPVLYARAPAKPAAVSAAFEAPKVESRVDRASLALGGVGLVALIGSGVLLGLGELQAVGAREATDYGAYEVAAGRAGGLRLCGGIAAAVGGVLVGIAIVKLLVTRRSAPLVTLLGRPRSVAGW